jgi:hypothetical protein
MKQCRLLAITLILMLVTVSVAAATSFIIKVGERTALATALQTDLASGHLKIYSGAAPGVENAVTGTLLVDWTLNATNTVSNGVLTLGTVTNVNASATNTAGYARFTKADGTTAVAEMDVGTASTSLILNTTSIVSGGPCSLSGTVTVPAGT